MTCFGIDTGTRSLAEADEAAHDLVHRLRLPAQAIVCTHLARGEPEHVALSLWVPPGFDGVWNELTRLTKHGEAGVASGTGRSGRPDLADAAADAAVEHLSRQGGRAVVFPGSAQLTGTIGVADLIAHSAITQVRVAGGGAVPDGVLLDTRDHVRPRWQAGELVLTVAEVHNGRYVPCEVPGAVGADHR